MIYFVEAEGLPLVKIGYAKNVKDRLMTLQTGLPMRLRLIDVVEGGWADERRLHKALAAHRIRGEWFNRSGALWALRILRRCGTPAISAMQRMANNASTYKKAKIALVRQMMERQIKALANDVLRLTDAEIKGFTDSHRITWVRARNGYTFPESHTCLNAFAMFPRHLRNFIRGAFRLDLVDASDLRPLIPQMAAIVDEADALRGVK